MLTFRDLIQVSAATVVLAPQRGVGTRGDPGRVSMVRVAGGSGGGGTVGTQEGRQRRLLYYTRCFLSFM